MIDIEEFRDVPGYEGLYEVSNKGRVRRNGKILKPTLLNNGYLRVELHKQKTEKQVLVHRLVAMTFILNPNNLPCVNHKDEDKTNNAVDNLEWCTHEYNTNYGTRNERASINLSKPILQFDLQGSFIKEWSSGIEAEEFTKISRASICSCCKGNLKTAGGFVWKYKN